MSILQLLCSNHDEKDNTCNKYKTVFYFENSQNPSHAINNKVVAFNNHSFMK